MENILAPAHIHHPNNSANGRVPRRSPEKPGIPQVTRRLHTEEDGLCHDRLDRRGWIMVRGRGHDLGQRPDGHLQLLRLLGLRLQHPLTARQTALRQSLLGPPGHRRRPHPRVRGLVAGETRGEIRGIRRRRRKPRRQLESDARQHRYWYRQCLVRTLRGAV